MAMPKTIQTRCGWRYANKARMDTLVLVNELEFHS